MARRSRSNSISSRLVFPRGRPGGAKSPSYDAVVLRFPPRPIGRIALGDRRRWHPEGMLAAPVVLGDRGARRLKLDAKPKVVVRRTAAAPGGMGPLSAAIHSFRAGFGSAGRRSVSRSARSQSVPTGVAFSRPSSVGICIRRKERREVLAAKKRLGGGHRRGRRNWWSSINC